MEPHMSTASLAIAAAIAAQPLMIAALLLRSALRGRAA
jgi:hypothetical protein